MTTDILSKIRKRDRALIVYSAPLLRKVRTVANARKQTTRALTPTESAELGEIHLSAAGAEPLTRCRLKLPDHWTGAGASSLRWLGSGGSPLVFGVCTPGNCPDRKGSV